MVRDTRECARVVAQKTVTRGFTRATANARHPATLLAALRRNPPRGTAVARATLVKMRVDNGNRCDDSVDKVDL